MARFPAWRALWRSGSGRLQLDPDTTYAPSLVAIIGTVDEGGEVRQPNTNQLVYRRHFFVKQTTADPVDVCVINAELGVPISDIGNYEVRLQVRQDLKGDLAEGDDVALTLKSDADYAQIIEIDAVGQIIAGGVPNITLFPSASSITTGWNILQVDSPAWASSETFWFHIVVEIYKLPTGILKPHSTHTP